MNENEDKQIVYMPPDELMAYPNNIRKHTENDLAIIRKSIVDYGFQDPVTVDPYMTIIEGHGRTIVAKELIENKVKVAIKTENPHVMERIPVIMSDLEGSNADEYRLVHNKTGEIAGYDMDKYGEVIDELVQRSGFDAEGFCFTLPENPMNDVVDSVQKAEEEAVVNEKQVSEDSGTKFIVMCDSEEQRAEAIEKLSGMSVTIQML